MRVYKIVDTERSSEREVKWKQFCILIVGMQNKHVAY